MHCPFHGASGGQRIIRSEYSVRQSVESPLQEKEASHRVEDLHEHPTNISPEGRIELCDSFEQVFGGISD